MASSSAEVQEGYLLELFDLFWFQHTVFVGKRTAPEQPIVAGPESVRLDESHEVLVQKSELSRVNTLNARSMSDPCLEVDLGLTESDSAASPKSVLASPKLRTILSGKEVTEFPGGETVEETVEVPRKEQRLIDRRRRRKMKMKMKMKKKEEGNSKSLSELEFEELKGFMDLGFVFSEQDRDSADLVSIIPGLQRLGRNHQSGDAEGGGDIEAISEISVPRPYLSESWEILDRRKKLDPLMNWRVPDLGNEMAVKDQLKFWAHAVASAVR